MLSRLTEGQRERMQAEEERRSYGAQTMLETFVSLVSAHADAVPQRFLECLDAALPQRRILPQPLAATRWLDRIAEIASPEAKPLATALSRCRHDLHWGQTYRAEDFGARFLENYGWVELFGLRGHFVHEAVAGGLLLLGPQTLYPDHHHAAEEIYLPLTGGTEWRRGGSPFEPRAAGAVIHHPSEVSHAMRTGTEPLLALYLWRGGPLDQRSTIGTSGGVQKPSQTRSG